MICRDLGTPTSRAWVSTRALKISMRRASGGVSSNLRGIAEFLIVEQLQGGLNLRTISFYHLRPQRPVKSGFFRQTLDRPSGTSVSFAPTISLWRNTRPGVTIDK